MEASLPISASPSQPGCKGRVTTQCPAPPPTGLRTASFSCTLLPQTAVYGAEFLLQRTVRS